jgi:hypothetical protein
MVLLELSLEAVYDRRFGGQGPPLNQETDAQTGLSNGRMNRRLQPQY